MLMTLGEIQDEVEQISERWPAEMTAEQKKDLIDLDDLRGELDDLAHRTLRQHRGGRRAARPIEMLMDEIDISLGIEPLRPLSAGEDLGP